MRLGRFFQLHLKPEAGSPPSATKRLPLPPRLCVALFSGLRPGPGFPGGHRGEATPVPIPNTEVKGPIAEGTAGCACGRVGRRRVLSWGPRIARSAAPLFLPGRRRHPAGTSGEDCVRQPFARPVVAGEDARAPVSPCPLSPETHDRCNCLSRESPMCKEAPVPPPDAARGGLRPGGGKSL